MEEENQNNDNEMLTQEIVKKKDKIKLKFKKIKKKLKSEENIVQYANSPTYSPSFSDLSAPGTPIDTENEIERILTESQRVSNINLRITKEVRFTKKFEGKLAAAETIIVFDLHHVLMRPKYKLIAKIICKYPEKKQLLKLLKSAEFRKQFMEGVNSKTPEHLTLTIADALRDSKYEPNTEHLSRIMTEVCNCQQPDLPTFLLIQRIKEKGYGVYLLSNIGENHFRDLLAKVPDNLFTHFDGFYTSNAEDDYIRKPNLLIFQRFQKKFNGNGEKKNILFVDDSAVNINACYQTGMVGILYRSAHLLERDLIDIGLDINPLSSIDPHHDSFYNNNNINNNNNHSSNNHININNSNSNIIINDNHYNNNNHNHNIPLNYSSSRDEMEFIEISSPP